MNQFKFAMSVLMLLLFLSAAFGLFTSVIGGTANNDEKLSLGMVIAFILGLIWYMTHLWKRRI